MSSPMKHLGIGLALSAVALLLAPLMPLGADDAAPAVEKSGETAAAKPAEKAAEPVKPKPISEQVKKGLDYLVSQQHENGGWGQGGGWRIGEQGGSRVEGAEVKDPPDVGNTAAATLALIRAGNTLTQGPYAKNVAKAVAFIRSHIDKADDKSLWVTDIKGTQLQSKIGQYVDTFLAGLVLSELKGKMPDADSEKLLLAALNKAIKKIETNQQADGRFAGNDGWASVLSQGLCSKALNRASQKGVEVNGDALAADFTQAANNLKLAAMPAATPAEPPAGAIAVSDVSGRAVTEAPVAGGRISLGAAGGGSAGKASSTAPSDAGVKLYFESANISTLAEGRQSVDRLQEQAREVLKRPDASKEEKSKAAADLENFGKWNVAHNEAVDGLIKRLDDQAFIAGFGNNGGEEFLSYMNISETLVVKGGDEWKRWDKSIGENLVRIQNQDGSWSGQHCITGRTFCTSTALLTLLADRVPQMAAAKEVASK